MQHNSVLFLWFQYFFCSLLKLCLCMLYVRLNCVNASLTLKKIYKVIRHFYRKYFFFGSSTAMVDIATCIQFPHTIFSKNIVCVSVFSYLLLNSRSFFTKRKRFGFFSRIHSLNFRFCCCCCSCCFYHHYFRFLRYVFFSVVSATDHLPISFVVTFYFVSNDEFFFSSSFLLVQHLL